MNIFFLDKDPSKAAQFLVDKHLHKMLVESAQLLANCIPQDDLVKYPRTQAGTVRKHAWQNHPSARWTTAAHQSLNGFQTMSDQMVEAVSCMGKVHVVSGKPVCPNCTLVHRRTGTEHPLTPDYRVMCTPVFMVKKTNRFTDDWFYGCLNFPVCRHTQNRPKTRRERDLAVRSWAMPYMDQNRCTRSHDQDRPIHFSSRRPCR